MKRKSQTHKTGSTHVVQRHYASPNDLELLVGVGRSWPDLAGITLLTEAGLQPKPRQNRWRRPKGTGGKWKQNKWRNGSLDAGSTQDEILMGNILSPDLFPLAFARHLFTKGN